MLIGKKHKIHRVLKPLCLAVDAGIKKSFDCVRQPDVLRAVECRDALLNIQSEIDKIIFFVESRKWKETKEET